MISIEHECGAALDGGRYSMAPKTKAVFGSALRSQTDELDSDAG